MSNKNIKKVARPNVFRRVKKISELKPGKVVRHIDFGEGYVVTANYGSYAIGVRTAHITNPDEWLLVLRY